MNEFHEIQGTVTYAKISLCRSLEVSDWRHLLSDLRILALVRRQLGAIRSAGVKRFSSARVGITEEYTDLGSEANILSRCRDFIGGEFS